MLRPDGRKIGQLHGWFSVIQRVLHLRIDFHNINNNQATNGSMDAEIQ